MFKAVKIEHMDDQRTLLSLHLTELFRQLLLERRAIEHASQWIMPGSIVDLELPPSSWP